VAESFDFYGGCMDLEQSDKMGDLLLFENLYFGLKVVMFEVNVTGQI